MIDIQLLRNRPDWLKQKIQEKRVQVDVDKLIHLDNQRLALISQVEELRKKRNENADRMKGGKPDDGLIAQGKKIKEQLGELEKNLENTEIEWRELLVQIPNPSYDDVPVGGEEASIEIRAYGDKNTNSHDHLELAESRDWLDFERGAKVSGNKFFFIKGELALLENAIVQYALDKIIHKGFLFMNVPHLVNSRVASGTGFAPRTSEQNDEYFIEGEDLTLIATAEAPLTGFHADEIIDQKSLPLMYVGYSPCYRKEAGSYGKHTRGLFRVHQFNKLEMYVYCLPEDSQRIHEELLNIEEEIWQELGIPYHVINIASGDLGAPAAKKYDIEYWSPVDQVYREITSCSNCSDYQARNLNIRVRRDDGTVEYAHTLNGTVVSMARTLVAVIEHYQTDDGKLKVPEVVQKYMRGKTVL